MDDSMDDSGPSLMQRGQQKVADEQTGPSFTPKDAREHVPPEQHDAIDRVVAAGVRVMYSPGMADEREAALSASEPMPKLLADNVTGLMLTLDQKSKGGIPQATIFPAAVMLLNEVANFLVEAGKKVSEDDYNSALQLLYVQLGKKLGATDDQLMHGAEQALQKSQGGDEGADDAGSADETDPTEAGAPPPDAGNIPPPPPAGQPVPPDEEEEPQ